MESTQSSFKPGAKRVCKATQATLNHILTGTTDRMILRRQQSQAADADHEEPTSPTIFIKTPSNSPLQLRKRDQTAFDPHKEQIERRLEKLLKFD